MFLSTTSTTKLSTPLIGDKQKIWKSGCPSNIIIMYLIHKFKQTMEYNKQMFKQTMEHAMIKRSHEVPETQANRSIFAHGI